MFVLGSIPLLPSFYQIFHSLRVFCVCSSYSLCRVIIISGPQSLRKFVFSNYYGYEKTGVLDRSILERQECNEYIETYTQRQNDLPNLCV